MERRRRLAVLTGEPDKEDQSQFIEGFLSQTMQEDFDVCVFAMHKMYQNSANRELGDSKIFSLLPYDGFEAIVVLADKIQTGGVVEQIEEELNAYYGGSVLFVDRESRYFPSVCLEDVTLTKDMISHLIEEHGYKDIAYLTGKSWNIHAQNRLQAYREAMEEHGLSVREDRIFYGDFWYTSGESMVDKMLRNREDLPRAIACGNTRMAIGVSNALTKAGISIPDEIAVVGYDYMEEGALSPIPVTAQYIEHRRFGVHCAKTICAMLRGEETEEFFIKPKLFYGRSCGCCREVDYQSLVGRKTWETPDYSDGYFGSYNTLAEDIMCQNKLMDLYNVIFSYVYQLEDYEGFYLCLNEPWLSEKTLSDPELDWSDYTENMLLAVRAGGTGQDMGGVSTSRTFPRQQLLPELSEERDTPRAFFFSPVFFEDKCFGYAAVSYGEQPHSITKTYHHWISTVIRGLESVRRNILAGLAAEKLADKALRDEKTGLRNYRGLKRDAEALVVGCHVSILALDIKALAAINKDFGREEGDAAIRRVGRCVDACQTVAISCCLGNDEFLLISVVDEDGKKDAAKQELAGLLDEANKTNKKYKVELCQGQAEGLVQTEEDFDHLINAAVSQKLGNKTLEKRMQNVVNLTEEDKKISDLVQEVLTNNRLTYHFQPIINAKTGEIYSYEALMRAQTKEKLLPPDIIKYAEALRLTGAVEKYTFVNVISYMQQHEELFAGRKVFINSIPGTVLEPEDDQLIGQLLADRNGQVVVELTEQAELDDTALMELKERYERVGVELAVDDYGTGYSNVTNLLRYMPRYVKIDRMLLSGIENSPQKQHFVKEIIEFAHNNNILALAEGVETSEELEMVIRLGADLIQGFYVARPSAEVLQAIPVQVKREIYQFSLQGEYNKNRGIYVAGREFRISLAKLMSEDYECILVTNEETLYHDLNISGVPGSKADMVIRIADGYHGRVQLENVCLAGKRGDPSIVLGENCDVTLVLVGENVFSTGGICVPESSRLILEGEGGLSISCEQDGCYGIGNGMESRHGDIVFEQLGLVEVHTNGALGVAVGSGLGGKVCVRKGKLSCHMVGKRGVGIGNVSGTSEVEIISCDVFVNGALYEGAGIGSLNGALSLATKHVYINCKLTGTNLVGFGVHGTGENSILLQNGNFDLSLHALNVCGVGSFHGESEIRIRYALLKLDETGTTVIAVGDGESLSSLELKDAEIDLDCRTESDKLFGISPDRQSVDNGRFNFRQNGKAIDIF